MGQPKGRSGNPKGRPPGAQNTLSREVKQIMADILKKRLKNIYERLDNCEPKDELVFLAKISEFVVAKPAPEQLGTEVPVVSTAEAAAQLTLVKKKTGT